MRYGTSSLSLNADRCNGCGACLEVCPHAVLVRAGRRVRIERPEDCMECGACQRNCLPGALSVAAGVGCAAALINGALTGREACCGPQCPDSRPSGPSRNRS